MSRMNGKKTHTHTSSTLLYSSIIRLYPHNPVFEIVRDESVKVYLHMYKGNVQQNLLCVEFCVTMYSPAIMRYYSNNFCTLRTYRTSGRRRSDVVVY